MSVSPGVMGQVWHRYGAIRILATLQRTADTLAAWILRSRIRMSFALLPRWIDRCELMLVTQISHKEQMRITKRFPHVRRIPNLCLNAPATVIRATRHQARVDRKSVV